MIREITDILAAKYERSEARALAQIIATEATQMNLNQLFLAAPSIDDFPRLRDWVNRLLNYEPLQYIMGYTTFCDHIFYCDSRALIPRPETEELVNWVLDSADKNSSLRIQDIGTGTGCIALSLALALPESSVVASDISSDALDLARANAKNLDVANVSFLQQDILNPEDSDDIFDIIVANPPYITPAEMSEMSENVLDYEPHSALFVPADRPLLFYEAIVEYAKKHLNGALYMEINQYLADEMKALLSDAGFSNVEVRRDMFDNQRMIYGYRTL